MVTQLIPRNTRPGSEDIKYLVAGLQRSLILFPLVERSGCNFPDNVTPEFHLRVHHKQNLTQRSLKQHPTDDKTGYRGVLRGQFNAPCADPNDYRNCSSVYIFFLLDFSISINSVFKGQRRTHGGSSGCSPSNPKKVSSLLARFLV